MTTTGDPLNDGLRSSSPHFDIRDFTRTAQGNFRSEIDLAAYETHPLDQRTLSILRYMTRLEAATMEHLRNLLVTATHKDARVTAFLVTWAFEKFWIADALDSVLEAHGLDRTKTIPEGDPRRSVSDAVERRGPIRRAIIAVGLGAPIVAVHMVTGLVDEWILRAAYDRIRATTPNEALQETITKVQTIKKRHEAFFADETDWRLRDSARAVRQTKAALATAVWPIGAVERAATDRDLFESYVFGGPEGSAAADAIGEQVAALPGLDRRIGQVTARKLLP
ncbi:hypothetical protein [Frondihabitans cladoniiphilus]|uniref:Uncharacterized protein n=1 Tax=Frondihabitans cladoniiphilus TaxID=715785 RepID=A0ABP8W510_9MICO